MVYHLFLKSIWKLVKIEFHDFCSWRKSNHLIFQNGQVKWGIPLLKMSTFWYQRDKQMASLSLKLDENNSWKKPVRMSNQLNLATNLWWVNRCWMNSIFQPTYRIEVYSLSQSIWYPYYISPIEMRSLWTEMKYIKSVASLRQRLCQQKRFRSF